MIFPIKPYHHRDLREYIDALRGVGELQSVEREVGLHLEIGAICRRCYETGAPAPLFNRIKGVERGFCVLGAPAGVSGKPGLGLASVALSLGLPATSTGREIVAALMAARSWPGIKPRVIAKTTAPCKENILLGDDVNLNRLPVPWLHSGDSGRFINTFGLFCVRTPDGRWTNWSSARAMIVDGRSMAGIVAPNQHLGIVRKE